VSPPCWYPPITPTMWPVSVAESKWVIQGLPLVPPVNPPQLNSSWLALCSVVQFRQVMGSLELCG